MEQTELTSAIFIKCTIAVIRLGSFSRFNISVATQSDRLFQDSTIVLNAGARSGSVKAFFRNS
jgi:hypothetical protein